MKVIGYLRVSTDKQAEEGLGLEIQERAIRKWAKEHGHRVVEVFTDVGVSGSNGIEDRRELPALFEALRAGPATGLVVYRLDRLARDLVLQEQLLMEVRHLGGEAFSTASGEQDFLRDDPDDPSRRLIRQVLGAVSEYERAMIRLRLRRGRERKAEKGGYAGGRPRYGYRAEAKELVPWPAEQAVLTRVRELRQDSLSLREIAAALEAEGIRPRSAGTWHPTTLSRLIAQT